MSDLKALRLSIGATPKRMAEVMSLPLGTYLSLERGDRLDDRQLREATFAALRIALLLDGHKPVDSELFNIGDDLIRQFSQLGRDKLTLH